MFQWKGDQFVSLDSLKNNNQNLFLWCICGYCNMHYVIIWSQESFGLFVCLFVCLFVFVCFFPSFNIEIANQIVNKLGAVGLH